jgi:glutathione synthase
MGKNHLFVLDPLASLNLALDSSLRMAFELSRLGHAVYAAEPRDLATGSSGPTTARCRRLTFGATATETKVDAPAVRPLTDFAAVHMRKDPPYDLDYVTSTWLLDRAGPGVKVYNSPESLRRTNEKLAILRFPLDIAPTLVSADADALTAFLAEECQGDAVVKPLTLFGGRGVRRVTLGATAGGVTRDAARQIMLEETVQGTSLRLIQPFDRKIHDGEVRAFSAFGEPIAWCLKRPAAGQFLANTRMGAVLEEYAPTPQEVERVTRIARTLLAEGVALIGFDLIGGRLSEVNITSPRLLQAPSDKCNYYEKVAALMARDLGG